MNFVLTRHSVYSTIAHICFIKIHLVNDYMDDSLFKSNHFTKVSQRWSNFPILEKI